MTGALTYAGGGRIKRALSQIDIDKFEALGEGQRGAPERAMLRATRTMGGGVLPGVVEHVGDLTHRMTHHAKYGTAYPDLVQPKVKLGIDRFEYPYGFVREMEENFVANAKESNIPLEEFRKEVDMRLQKYADEHKKLKVHNRPQYFGREAAVAVGEQRWDDALMNLKKLQNILDTGEFEQEALKMVHKEGFAGGGKITRRGILQGIGGALAGALGLGKAGSKKGIEEAAEQLRKIESGLPGAAVAGRDLSGPFAKKVFSRKEWDVISEWIDEYRRGYLADMDYYNTRGGATPPEFPELEHMSETLDNILKKDPDEMLTQREHNIFVEVIEDAVDDADMPGRMTGKYPEGHPGKLFEEQWEILDNVERELYTPQGTVESWLKKGHEAVPDATDNAKAVFEDIVNDGRIWDDRLEYGPEDWEFQHTINYTGKGRAKKLTKEETEQIWKMVHAEDPKPKFAGGGKIRKLTRREVLKGLGAAGAGALGAGKAGTKRGIEEAAEALPEAAPVIKKALGTSTFRKADFTKSEWKIIDEYLDFRKEDLDDRLSRGRPDTDPFPIEIEEELDEIRILQDAEMEDYLDEETVDFLEDFLEDRTSDAGLDMYDQGVGPDDIDVLEARRYNTTVDALNKTKGLLETREVTIPPPTIKKALGGRISKFAQKAKMTRLKQGPDLYETAMTAAKEGDVDSALEYLRQLQELLELDDDSFKKMLSSAHRGALDEIDPARELTPRKSILDLPERTGSLFDKLPSKEKIPEKLAEGGPPKPPKKGKAGALLTAVEMFARRAGKTKVKGMEIPEGYDSFFSRPSPRGNSYEIWGVTPEGREVRISGVGALGPEGMGDAKAAAEALTGAWNSGGFAKGLEKVPLEELFRQDPPGGREQLLSAEHRTKADVLEFPRKPLEGEFREITDVDQELMDKLRSGELPLEGAPKGNRLRSFQEHLDNLLKTGDPDEYELADLATIAEDALEPLEYESLMEDIYEAGLTPGFYSKFARQVPTDPDLTARFGGPESLRDILGITADSGMDIEKVLQTLREGVEGIPDDADQKWLQLKADVESLTPEQLQRDLMDIMEKQGQTPIDLRRVSVDELNRLQEQGHIPEQLYDELYNDMVDLESEFADIIYDQTGVWPDEVSIVPDLNNPETYVMEAFSQETGTKQHFAFDPERGPRAATPEEIRNFTTERDTVLQPQSIKETPPTRPGTLIRTTPTLAGKEFPDVTYIHEEIGNTLDDLFEMEYDLDVYIDEYNLSPDPDNPGGWLADDVIVREVDTNDLVGNEARNFRISPEGDFEELAGTMISPDAPKPKFQEGGSVKGDKSAMDYLRATGKSLANQLAPPGSFREDLARSTGKYVQDWRDYGPFGFKSQWHGINPTTGEVEYAGPGSGAPYPEDWLFDHDPEEYYAQLKEWKKDKEETGAIPGIVDELMLMPALPMVVEMMIAQKRAEKRGEELPEDYEPFIGAPDFSMDALDRAGATWEALKEKTGLPEPTGWSQNLATAGGIMAGQLPIPYGVFKGVKPLLGRLPGGKIPLTPALTKSQKVDRAIKEWTEHALPPEKGSFVGKLLGGSGEFFMPSIDPKLANYAAGTIVGGALLKWMTPEEAETVEAIREEYTPEQADLIAIYNDPNSTDEEKETVVIRWREIDDAQKEARLQEMLEQSEEGTDYILQQERGDEAMESLFKYPAGMAGGGKIKGITRRDLLKGLGAGAATAAAAGKAGSKKGIAEAGAELDQLAKALEEKTPVPKIAVPKGAAAQMREIADALRGEADDYTKMIDKPGAWELEEVQQMRVDAEDFDKIGELFDKGDAKAAAEHYDSLDTMAREQFYDLIPDEGIDNTRHILGQAGSDWETSPIHMTDEGDALFERLEDLAADGKYDELSGEIDRLTDLGFDTDDLNNAYRDDIRAARRGLKPAGKSRGFSRPGYAGPAGKLKKAGGGKIRRAVSRMSDIQELMSRPDYDIEEVIELLQELPRTETLIEQIQAGADAPVVADEMGHLLEIEETLEAIRKHRPEVADEERVARTKREALKSLEGRKLAGGGKIRKGLTRRDVLTGMAGAGAAALGAGKAGTKKGIEEAAEALGPLSKAAEVEMTDVTLGEFGPSTAKILKEKVGEYTEAAIEDILDDAGSTSGELVQTAKYLEELEALETIDLDTPLTKTQADEMMEMLQYELDEAKFDADVDVGQRLNPVMERLGGKRVPVNAKSARDIDWEKGPKKALDEWKFKPNQKRANQRMRKQFGLDEELPEMQKYRDYDKAYDAMEDALENKELELWDQAANKVEEFDDYDLTAADNQFLDQYEKQLLAELPEKMDMDDIQQVFKDRYFEGYPESYYYDPSKATRRRFAGGGKIKGFTRRDVLKGAGAAATVAGAGLGGAGKAGVKKGAAEAIEVAAKKAAIADPMKVFQMSELPQRLQRTLVRQAEEYLIDVGEVPPSELVGEEAIRANAASEVLDITDMDFADMVWRPGEAKPLEAVLEHGIERAEREGADAASIREALEHVRKGRVLTPNEFFKATKESAWDRPTAFWDYAERMGIKDAPELDMRELGNHEIEYLNKVFDGDIPEELLLDNWDT